MFISETPVIRIPDHMDYDYMDYDYMDYVGGRWWARANEAGPPMDE